MNKIFVVFGIFRLFIFSSSLDLNAKNSNVRDKKDIAKGIYLIDGFAVEIVFTLWK